MAKIQASIADVSTDFPVHEPGVYRFEITKVKDQEKDGNVVAYSIQSKITAVIDGLGESAVGQTVSDFVNLLDKQGGANQFGLRRLKQYFEAVLGKDVVKERGDDLDTDELQGGAWQGQLTIREYTKEGETEARQVNDIKSVLAVA